MIFDRYPIVNLPRQPAPVARRAVLSQTMSAEAQASAQVLASAQTHLARVNATYANLAALLGEERANQAVQEAQASVQAAQADYDALVGGAR